MFCRNKASGMYRWVSTGTKQRHGQQIGKAVVQAEGRNMVHKEATVSTDSRHGQRIGPSKNIRLRALVSKTGQRGSCSFQSNFL